MLAGQRQRCHIAQLFFLTTLGKLRASCAYGLACHYKMSFNVCNIGAHSWAVRQCRISYWSVTPLDCIHFGFHRFTSCYKNLTSWSWHESFLQVGTMWLWKLLKVLKKTNKVILVISTWCKLFNKLASFHFLNGLAYSLIWVFSNGHCLKAAAVDMFKCWFHKCIKNLCNTFVVCISFHKTHGEIQWYYAINAILIPRKLPVWKKSLRL